MTPVQIPDVNLSSSALIQELPDTLGISKIFNVKKKLRHFYCETHSEQPLYSQPWVILYGGEDDLCEPRALAQKHPRPLRGMGQNPPNHSISLSLFLHPK